MTSAVMIGDNGKARAGDCFDLKLADISLAPLFKTVNENVLLDDVIRVKIEHTGL